jgi:hypothetical protein
MVEEIRNSGGGAENDSGREAQNKGIARWLTRRLIGLLGLSAAVRSLLASRPVQRTAAVPEEIHQADDRVEHPHVRYEERDVGLGWILAIGSTAMVLAALIFYLLLWFFHDYKDYQATIKRSPYPLAPNPSQALPAEPRLEQLNRSAGIEKSNIYVRETAKEELLHSYGSTPDQGFVRIPIDRALALLANKLPARPEPPASQRRRANGLVDAGESNSGRMFREEPRWYEH